MFHMSVEWKFKLSMKVTQRALAPNPGPGEILILSRAISGCVQEGKESKMKSKQEFKTNRSNSNWNQPGHIQTNKTIQSLSFLISTKSEMWGIVFQANARQTVSKSRSAEAASTLFSLFPNKQPKKRAPSCSSALTPR